MIHLFIYGWHDEPIKQTIQAFSTYELAEEKYDRLIDNPKFRPDYCYITSLDILNY